jgi:gamma-glutamylcyclotransferase (GGCT)/AIG2-like uncharacterized protein YtfP
MPVIPIFSYGSNMLTARIKDRIKSYSILGVGFIKEHSLKIHKRSKDLSGKADAYYTGNIEDLVWGVVGEITEQDKVILDKIEGLGKGYNQKTEKVNLVDGSVINSIIYCADEKFIDRDLKPYHWYKRFVLEGAKENKLPDDYINKIDKIESIADNDTERSKKKLRIIKNAST